METELLQPMDSPSLSGELHEYSKISETEVGEKK